METSRTVAEIENEIAALAEEQSDLESQAAQLEQDIADNWRDNTGKIEAKHAQLSARLKALPLVRARLQDERMAALRRDEMARLDATLQHLAEHQARRAEHAAVIDDLQAKLKVQQALWGEVDNAMGGDSAAIEQLAHHVVEKLQAKRSDVKAMFSAAGWWPGYLDAWQQD